MPRIISAGKNSPIRSLWREFNSLDIFLKLFIVTIVLFTLSTPFIIYNYQHYDTHAQSQTERLREIAQLQGVQLEMQNTFAGSISPTPSGPNVPIQIKLPGDFNVVSIAHEIFTQVVQILSRIF